MAITQAQAFELAFSPDGQNYLARLLGSVRHLGPGYCTMTDDDETLSVSLHYCAFCNAIHGHAGDGEGDCAHKRALRLAMELEGIA